MDIYILIETNSRLPGQIYPRLLQYIENWFRSGDTYSRYIMGTDSNLRSQIELQENNLNVSMAI